MSLDVRPDHLKIVLNILNKHVPDREVWAFGSRATGNAKETSDLDLVIIGDTPLEFETLAALRDAFSESRIPYKVDMVDWATTAESFRAIIQHEKMILQEGKKKSGGGEEWENLLVADSPLEIIDGDRGVNYPKQDDFDPTGYCLFLNAGNVTTVGFNFSECSFISKEKEKLLRKGKLQRNDIILTTRGTVGNVALFDESVPWDHVRINSGMVLLRAEKSKLLPRFLYQFVRSNIFKQRVAALTTGSAQPQLPIRDIRRVELPLPPLPEQRAIAHILGTLDDKIELNRRMNETLAAMAQAIFKSWFVDFDPVRAKMEGRETGLPKEIEDLFPDSFEDSELGEIPRGWEVGAIGEIANIVGGSTPSTKEPAYWENGHHYWATPKDLSRLSTPVLLGTERKITDAGLAQIGSGQLPAGTVLLSSRAPIGYLAISEVPVSVNQGFIAMLPREEVSNLFIHYWAECAHEEIISRANGSTFLEISKANFRPIPVIRPTKSVMELFEVNARPLYLQIVRNERETMILSTLRNSLLPKLLSGEIRVKDSARLSIDYPSGVSL